MVKILWQDLCILAFVVTNLLALFLTQYATTTLSSASAYSQNIESNPVQRILLDVTWVEFGLRAFVYAMICAYYLYVRRKKDTSEIALWAFNLFALLMLFYGLTDLVNDGGVVAGLLWNH